MVTCSTSPLWDSVDFMMHVIVSWPAAPNQTMTLPSLCLTVKMRFFSWNAVLVLHQACILLWCPNNSILDSFVQWILLQKFWFVSTFSEKLHSGLCVYFREQTFAPCTPRMNVNLVLLFLIVKATTSTAGACYRSQKTFYGFWRSLLMSCDCSSLLLGVVSILPRTDHSKALLNI